MSEAASVPADEQPMTLTVPLPKGDVTVSAAYGAVAGAVGTVIVAHGAGTGKDHPFLLGFAEALRRAGLSTLRFSFPYAEAGRRMPGPATHAILTWRAAVDAMRERSSGRVIASGRSYGGRMASMAVAEGLRVDRLVYLGYPLHPPGRPEKPRVEHLPAIAVPQLFISGTNDPFIQPPAQFEDAVASCQDARVEWVEGGGHSFEVKGRPRDAAAIGASLAPLVTAFVRGD
ncbi:putative alpha/beta-hydrolase family hydrolase [Microbacterium resistens]|uniref:Alpha/beta-hydrolase family hydrolase n=1 Tax=Microbacterium resistens TaxID=156977 RepID=A0ABU1S7E5_9MICO|nr:alpha/beta family hydrolase [Microbacterium resistens]MDR6865535.1 putative alpha/beta-hydrolase family hydrolase [Microbacterium resistens]